MINWWFGSSFLHLAAKGKNETSAAQSSKRADGSSSSVRKFETQGFEIAAASLRSLRIC